MPAVGQHEVLVADTETWELTHRIAVAGQPVFVVARPDTRQVWVSFAFPDNSQVQIIDTETMTVTQTIKPGRAVLHMEFTPRGEAVWISSRDDNVVVVYETARAERIASIPAENPSGIFFTARAARIGF
jgi:protein NirF